MSYERITVASTRAAVESTGYALVRQSFLSREHRHACALGLHHLVVGVAAHYELPTDYRNGIEAGFERWNRWVFGPPDYQIGYRDGEAIRLALKPPLLDDYLDEWAERNKVRRRPADIPTTLPEGAFACSCASATA